MNPPSAGNGKASITGRIPCQQSASEAISVSGLATLLQTLGVWRIGARLPLVRGTSFAAVASMLAIGKNAGATQLTYLHSGYQNPLGEI